MLKSATAYLGMSLILRTRADVLNYMLPGRQFGSIHTHFISKGRTIHDGIAHDSALRCSLLAQLLDNDFFFWIPHL